MLYVCRWPWNVSTIPEAVECTWSHAESVKRRRFSPALSGPCFCGAPPTRSGAKRTGPPGPRRDGPSGLSAGRRGCSPGRLGVDSRIARVFTMKERPNPVRPDGIPPEDPHVRGVRRVVPPYAPGPPQSDGPGAYGRIWGPAPSRNSPAAGAQGPGSTGDTFRTRFS